MAIKFQSKANVNNTKETISAPIATLLINIKITLLIANN